MIDRSDALSSPVKVCAYTARFNSGTSTTDIEPAINIIIIIIIVHLDVDEISFAIR